LKGIAGSPQEVVLALSQVMALYNDQGMVNYVPTSSIAFAPTFTSFAYVGSNPQTIYALPFTIVQNSFFTIVTINTSGLGYTPLTGGNYGGNNTTGAQVVSDGTLLYTSAGEVWDPISQTQVGSFPVTTYNDTSYPNLYNLIMDVPLGHIFVIGDQPYAGDSSSVVLSAYDQQSLALYGALALPQVTAPVVNNLVRWGLNGFAFLAQDSSPYVQAVYLLTSSLAAPSTANAVPVLRSLNPSSIPQGSGGFQLTVNGQKFTQASVINWNGVAIPTTYVAPTVLTAAVPTSDLTSSGAATITVSTPPPGGGTSRSLQFAVATLVPVASFSVSAVSFAAQSVGSVSPPQTIALQNPGTATLAISKITVTGPNAGSFHASSNCGRSLAPGANCVISVIFSPSATGSLSAFVSLTDNATGSPQTVSLSGTGN
jgi:hypothetical protein